MVAGVHTLPGQPAARLVVVELRAELVLAPTQNLPMVERIALDLLRKLVNAIRTRAQVRTNTFQQFMQIYRRQPELHSS